ncbi:MAG: hypothetical protein R2735_14680 [Microthrixaceae bacterium]
MTARTLTRTITLTMLAVPAAQQPVGASAYVRGIDAVRLLASVGVDRSGEPVAVPVAGILGCDVAAGPIGCNQIAPSAHHNTQVDSVSWTPDRAPKQSGPTCCDRWCHGLDYAARDVRWHIYEFAVDESVDSIL